MAYVTANSRGGFEVRESRTTTNGPRSRTLATFRRLDDEVIARVRERAEKPPSAEELREAALRAGAPIAAAPVDQAAAETVRRLARGERVDPMLRRLLLDSLGRQERGERFDAPGSDSDAVSDAARSAAEWIGVGLERRSEAFVDLLGLADALPPASPPGAPSMVEKIEVLDRTLAGARIAHAFSGRVALAYYGMPELTKRIEVSILTPVDRWPDVREALAPLSLGPEVRLEPTQRAPLSWDDSPIDLDFSYAPFHDEMRRAVRRAPLGGQTIPVLAPEHLLVCKAMFDRPKDWLDIEQVLVATDPLDLPEVEAWLESMVGEDNPRLTRLSELREQLSR